MDYRNISLHFEIPENLPLRDYEYEIEINIQLTNFIPGEFEEASANTVQLRYLSGSIKTLPIGYDGKINQTVLIRFDDNKTFELLIYPIDPIITNINVTGTVKLLSFKPLVN